MNTWKLIIIIILMMIVAITFYPKKYGEEGGLYPPGYEPVVSKKCIGYSYKKTGRPVGVDIPDSLICFGVVISK